MRDCASVYRRCTKTKTVKCSSAGRKPCLRTGVELPAGQCVPGGSCLKYTIRGGELAALPRRADGFHGDNVLNAAQAQAWRGPSVPVLPGKAPPSAQLLTGGNQSCSFLMLSFPFLRKDPRRDSRLIAHCPPHRRDVGLCRQALSAVAPLFCSLRCVSRLPFPSEAAGALLAAFIESQ